MKIRTTALHCPIASPPTPTTLSRPAICCRLPLAPADSDSCLFLFCFFLAGPAVSSSCGPGARGCRILLSGAEAGQELAFPTPICRPPHPSFTPSSLLSTPAVAAEEAAAPSAAIVAADPCPRHTLSLPDRRLGKATRLLFLSLLLAVHPLTRLRPLSPHKPQPISPRHPTINTFFSRHSTNHQHRPQRKHLALHSASRTHLIPAATHSVCALCILCRL